jgi:acyl dehydratase
MSISIEERKEWIGWESQAFEVTLTRRGIREFAKATYHEDSMFESAVDARADGFSDIPAAVTFFGSVLFVDFDTPESDLSFATENALHGEQSFEFKRVQVAGQTLYGKNVLDDVYQKERSEGRTITSAEFETPLHDEDGDLVLTAYKTHLRCSMPMSEAEGNSPEPEVGDSGPPLTVDVSRQDIAKYAGASGDFSPIHLYTELATLAGYDSEIAQGMFTAGLAGSMVHKWFGVDSIEPYSVQFREVVYPGDTMMVTGEVTGTTDATATATIGVTNQNDAVVLSGTFTAGVAD